MTYLFNSIISRSRISLDQMMTLNKEEKSRSQLIYHLQGRSYRDLAKVTLSILATFTIFTCGNGMYPFGVLLAEICFLKTKSKLHV